MSLRQPITTSFLHKESEFIVIAVKPAEEVVQHRRATSCFEAAGEEAVGCVLLDRTRYLASVGSMTVFYAGMLRLQFPEVERMLIAKQVALLSI